MHRCLVAVLATTFLAMPVPVVASSCGDEAADASAVATVEAAVESACDCTGSDDHVTYARCARTIARAAVRGRSLRPPCLKSVARCASRSTCGRPGWVACCLVRDGETRCHPTSSAERCAARGGCPSAVPSCCAACGSGGCATTSTTSTPTTSSTSADTSTSTTSLACAGGGNAICATTSTTTTSAVSTTTCAPVCGNGLCELGEAPGTCDCGLVGQVFPLLPVAVGACHFDAFAETGSCGSLPLIQVPDAADDACFSSLSSGSGSASALIDLLPSTCCAGATCGGGQNVDVTVGDVIHGMNGQVGAVLDVLKDCLVHGPLTFEVPIVACGRCSQTNTILGFARVDLEAVVTQVAQQFVALTVPCPRCGDRVCTAPDEDCRSCWVDCGQCVPACR